MIQVFTNINEVLTLNAAHKKDGRNLIPSDADILTNASLVFDDEQILWIGASDKLPSEYEDYKKTDLSNHCLTPELVDSHTHIVFGGNRAQEYTQRLNGADYQVIAKNGGGILATMKGTNELSDDELFQLACERIERLYSYGIGTIEIKSGYALTYEGEKRCSLIIDRLKKHFAPRVQIFNTYLAAHAVPKQYSSSQEYLNQVVLPLLDDLAPMNVIDAVDIFHEDGYFSLEDSQQLFERATALGISLKIHADEFNDNGGAKLAASMNALSADHLLCTGKDGIKTLADSSTVATVLPGTGWFLGKPQANVKSLLEAGCKLAIASDYNPGSCHCDNLLLLASMAAPTYPLNMTQMWSAITLNASAALGLKNQGAIVKGLKPRFSIFKVNNISEITYSWGRNFATNSFC